MEKKDTLLSLAENNIEYDSMIKQFNRKIKTGLKFYSKQEFIESEIKRIKNFIQPVQITIGGDFKKGAEMNYSDYVKYAYEWLSMGQDWEIEQIISGAKNQYLSKYPNGSYNEEEFKTAVIGNLRKGVAYLKYQKFLKEKLQQNAISPKIKTSKSKRISIPRKSIALLQKEINSICPFCKSPDVDHFEIHHIDENRSNNDLNNLIMLCPTCHSKITKGDISQEAVINKKKSLQSASSQEIKDEIGKIHLSVGVITSPFEEKKLIALVVTITSKIKEHRFFNEPYFLLSNYYKGNNAFSLINREYLGAYPFKLEFGEQKKLYFTVDGEIHKMFEELSETDEISAVFESTIDEKITSNSIEAKAVKDLILLSK